MHMHMQASPTPPPAHPPTHKHRTHARAHTHTGRKYAKVLCGNSKQLCGADGHAELACQTQEHGNAWGRGIEASNWGNSNDVFYNPKSADHAVSKTRTRYPRQEHATTCAGAHTHTHTHTNMRARTHTHMQYAPTLTHTHMQYAPTLKC
jgi:hypothetical protein